MEESLDKISSLLPVDFFSFSFSFEKVEKKEALKKKHLFPDFSPLHMQKSFALLKGGWSEEGLFFHVEVDKPFEECFFPEYRKGDSIEFFIDTRDLKSAKINTRFCHHFVFLPRSVEGQAAHEVTCFRGEDSHLLCDPLKLHVESDFHKKSFFLNIFIPSDCLHGYDTLAFRKLGFTYRINRYGGKPQCLALSSSSVSIEEQPSLWASLKMEGK